MGTGTNRTAAGLLTRWARGLRFPQLLVVTAVLFVLDLIFPDIIPFVDEALLGLATLLLASWRRRKSEPAADATTAPGERGDGSGRVIDVTPEE